MYCILVGRKTRRVIVMIIEIRKQGITAPCKLLRVALSNSLIWNLGLYEKLK